MSYYSLIMQRNPTRYFRCNETSGTTLVDASNNAVNGSLQNSGISYSQAGALIGDPNHALLFTVASSGFGSFGAHMTDGLTQFSLGFWFNLTSNGYAGSPCFFSNDNPQSTNVGVRINLTSNSTRSFVFTIGNGAGGHGTANVGDLVNAGVWHYYVCTYDGSLSSLNLKVYKDGPRVRTGGLASSTVGNAAHNMGIANDGSGASLFGGLMDEIEFYSGVVLTPDQIQETYNAGLTGVIQKWQHKPFARVI